MEILIPVLVVGGVGLFFGFGLGIASKKLYVFIDPRIEKIQSILPNANCGACGYPGCGVFAKHLVEGKAQPSDCIPGGAKTANQVAEILGLGVQTTEPKMAIVHCKGGKKEAKDRAIYLGLNDCNASVIAGNGSKECENGCLGLGTCVSVCPFNAITINGNNVAVVNYEICTGCGKCVSVCPHGIIELIPKVFKIFVACSNKERGAKVKKYCSIGCTGCTLCVKATPSGAITMKNNLPVLDYSKEENFISAKYKCPQKCFADMAKSRPKANIDTKCNGCGECIPACPVKNTITGEIGSRHTIDRKKCIGCGLCLNKCPEHAISLWGGLGYSPDDKSKRQRSF
ncbi:MAG: RnfABCDGE type electron transport complex subunit B [Chitinispirillia bacterium]|jgi:Na+-translocating ferredoxin:NAD+ oxidoreductase RNF subunit RnfB